MSFFIYKAVPDRQLVAARIFYQTLLQPPQPFGQCSRVTCRLRFCEVVLLGRRNAAADCSRVYLRSVRQRDQQVSVFVNAHAADANAVPSVLAVLSVFAVRAIVSVFPVRAVLAVLAERQRQKPFLLAPAEAVLHGDLVSALAVPAAERRKPLGHTARKAVFHGKIVSALAVCPILAVKPLDQPYAAFCEIERQQNRKQHTDRQKRHQ